MYVDFGNSAVVELHHSKSPVIGDVPVDFHQVAVVEHSDPRSRLAHFKQVIPLLASGLTCLRSSRVISGGGGGGTRRIAGNIGSIGSGAGATALCEP